MTIFNSTQKYATNIAPALVKLQNQIASQKKNRTVYTKFYEDIANELYDKYSALLTDTQANKLNGRNMLNYVNNRTFPKSDPVDIWTDFLNYSETMQLFFESDEAVLNYEHHLLIELCNFYFEELLKGLNNHKPGTSYGELVKNNFSQTNKDIPKIAQIFKAVCVLLSKTDSLFKTTYTSFTDLYRNEGNSMYKNATPAYSFDNLIDRFKYSITSDLKVLKSIMNGNLPLLLKTYDNYQLQYPIFHIPRANYPKYNRLLFLNRNILYSPTHPVSNIKVNRHSSQRFQDYNKVKTTSLSQIQKIAIDHLYTLLTNVDLLLENNLLHRYSKFYNLDLDDLNTINLEEISHFDLFDELKDPDDLNTLSRNLNKKLKLSKKEKKSLRNWHKRNLSDSNKYDLKKDYLKSLFKLAITLTFYPEVNIFN